MPNGSALKNTLILTQLVFDVICQEARAPGCLECVQDRLPRFFYNRPLWPFIEQINMLQQRKKMSTQSESAMKNHDFQMGDLFDYCCVASIK